MHIRPIIASALLVLLSACATQPTPTTGALLPDSAQAIIAPSDNKLDATLWMQQSAEYEAAMLGSFALARQQLDRALADPDWAALPAGRTEEGRGGKEGVGT